MTCSTYKCLFIFSSTPHYDCRKFIFAIFIFSLNCKKYHSSNNYVIQYTYSGRGQWRLYKRLLLKCFNVTSSNRVDGGPKSPMTDGGEPQFY